MAEQENSQPISQEPQRLAIEAAPQRLAIEPPQSTGGDKPLGSVDSQGSITPPEQTTPPAPFIDAKFPPAPSQEDNKTEQDAQQSAEKKVSPEKVAEVAGDLTTQPVGRLIASTVDREALEGNEFDEEKAKEVADAALQKSPEDLPGETIAGQSYDARKKRWEGDKDFEGNVTSLDKRAEKWRNSLSRWIEEKTTPDAENSEELAASFKALGVNINEKGKRDDQLEVFRQKYVHNEEDKAKEGLILFAKDFADDCREKDGTIDFDKLNKRLTASKELFNIFGTDNNINETVKDYAAAHAILSAPKDDEGVHNAVRDKIAQHLQEEVTDPSEKDRLRALYDKQQESEEPEPEPEQEPEERDTSEEEVLSDEDLESLIEEAKKNALEKRDRQKLSDEIGTLIAKLKQGKLENEELFATNERITEINDQLKMQGTATAASTDEFRRILTLMKLSDERIEEAMTKAEAGLNNLPTENTDQFVPLRVVQFTKEEAGDGNTELSYSISVVPYPKEAIGSPGEQPAS